MSDFSSVASGKQMQMTVVIDGQRHRVAEAVAHLLVRKEEQIATAYAEGFRAGAEAMRQRILADMERRGVSSYVIAERHIRDISLPEPTPLTERSETHESH